MSLPQTHKGGLLSSMGMAVAVWYPGMPPHQYGIPAVADVLASDDSYNVQGSNSRGAREPRDAGTRCTGWKREEDTETLSLTQLGTRTSSIGNCATLPRLCRATGSHLQTHVNPFRKRDQVVDALIEVR